MTIKNPLCFNNIPKFKSLILLLTLSTGIISGCDWRSDSQLNQTLLNANPSISSESGNRNSQSLIDSELEPLMAKVVPTNNIVSIDAADGLDAIETTDTKTHTLAKSTKVLDPKLLVAKLTAPVNDFTNTLSTEDIQSLNIQISDIYKTGLLQIGVVLVPTTGDLSIFDYAMTVANEWQLGSSDNNNGVLVLMAIEDRQLYILTGTDVETKLTDKYVNSVIDTYMTPEFKKQNYAKGLQQAIDALVSAM